MKKLNDFGNGYIFISGATGGIGKAFCEAFALRGAKLFITGRSYDKLTKLKTALQEKYGVVCEIYACDLTDIAAIKTMLTYADGKGIVFSGIINVAGVDIQKPFADYTEEKLLFQLRVNAVATLYLTHALIKRKAEGKARVITVSSMSGASPMPYFAVYSATKAMLTNFFTALHYELKEKGVNVTVALPGGVYTRPDVIEDIKGQGLWGKLSAKTPQYVVNKIIKASNKNKIKCIPGFFNRFLYFIMKLLPKRLVLSFIANRWKKQTKDAF